jgi:hydroxymethylpyrimidine/phosphomethylpyrimidine kinase
MSDPVQPPVALTIAGSDNSAGAGIQADLKTFGAYSVYGLTAVTCVVAEVPGNVRAIQPVNAEVVREQVRLSLEVYPVAALKTGMLYSENIVETVYDAIEKLGKSRPFIVVDPVMVATSGDPLLKPAAVSSYKNKLLPLADLITPNLDEVRTLLGRPIATLEAMREAACELYETFGAGVLVKGAHLRAKTARDVLLWDGKITELSAPFIKGVSTHGTGCTYSAAITAGVACGMKPREAVAQAKEFVTAAISGFFRWRKGGSVTDALNHLRLRRA